MTERIQALKYELETLERSLSDPALLSDPAGYRKTMRRYSEVKEIVEAAVKVESLESQLAGLDELLSDPELRAEAESDEHDRADGDRSSEAGESLHESAEAEGDDDGLDALVARDRAERASQHVEVAGDHRQRVDSREGR